MEILLTAGIQKKKRITQMEGLFTAQSFSRLSKMMENFELKSFTRGN